MTTGRSKSVKCPKCGSRDIVSDLDVGERVCTHCGLVIDEDVLEVSRDWKDANESGEAERRDVGFGELLYAYSGGSATSFDSDKDVHGRQLPLESRLRMDRLKRYDARSRLDDTWRRNMSIAMAELDRLATALALPPGVKKQTAQIYRKALAQDLIRGRSIDDFVAASVYAACRQAEVPRPLKAVSEASGRRHDDITRTYRLLVKELRLKPPIDGPMKFVPAISTKLNLRSETEKKAVDILRRAAERRALVGKEPRGLAAAALYIACLQVNDKRIQRQVAKAAGTTEVTLRKRVLGLEATLSTTVHH